MNEIIEKYELILSLQKAINILKERKNKTNTNSNFKKLDKSISLLENELTKYSKIHDYDIYITVNRDVLIQINKEHLIYVIKNDYIHFMYSSDTIDQYYEIYEDDIIPIKDLKKEDVLFYIQHNMIKDSVEFKNLLRDLFEDQDLIFSSKPIDDVDIYCPLFAVSDKTVYIFQ